MPYTTGTPSCPQPFIMDLFWKNTETFCLNTYELFTSTALESVAMACNVKSNTDFSIDEKYPAVLSISIA